MGYAFERVCLIHVPQMKEKLGIRGVLTEICSWQCRKDEEKGLFGSQIDLLIVRRDQVIDLCEMKYSGAEYTVTAKDERDIRRRVSDLSLGTGTKYAVHPVLVTTHGTVDGPHAQAFQAVITMDDLFAY